MKKFRKLLAGLLTAVLLAGMLLQNTLPVYAEGAPPSGGSGTGVGYYYPMPEVLNFRGEPAEVFISHAVGNGGDSWQYKGVYPSGVVPADISYEYPIEGEQVAIDVWVEPSTVQSDIDSPYYQNDYKPLSARFIKKRDGTITVEKLGGDGSVEYDAAKNKIILRPEAQELHLNTPRETYSNYDNAYQLHGDHVLTHYYAFVPPASGEYDFFSSDNYGQKQEPDYSYTYDYIDLWGALYDEDGTLIAEDDDSGGNSNFLLQGISLTKDKTYYLGVRRAGKGDSALDEYRGSFMLNVRQGATAPTGAPDTEAKKDGYLTLHVKKEWKDGKTEHAPVKVKLTPSNAIVAELTLSQDNGWTGAFENLPLYDAQGVEITYSVEEEDTTGYSAVINATEENSRQEYWVMINAPDELEVGREYVILAQDWGQAMYFNNPNTYYFLTKSPDGDGGNIGLQRIERTDTVFTGPKTGNGTASLWIGGKEYTEYLRADSLVTQSISSGERWVLGESGGRFTLANRGAARFMTLKGENQWWNYGNPHLYSFIESNEDGWHGNENINYAHFLEFFPAADGMAHIAASQDWGNGWHETRYLYLDLTQWYQKTAATDYIGHSGQFKFFTPISKVEKTVSITNTPVGKRSVSVEKRWKGAAAEHVTIRLLADGKDTGEKLKLGENALWKGSFDNLEKYDAADGHEIIYTVQEELTEGYAAEIAGDMNAGFVITNRSTTGSLNIKKIVSGKDAKAEDRFGFRIWLSQALGGKEYALQRSGGTKEHIRFATASDAVSDYECFADIRLKAGEAVRISGLPEGVEYLVEETGGYGEIKPFSFEERGTVSAEKPCYVLFVNRKDPTTGVFIRKEWEDNGNRAGKRPEFIKLSLVPEKIDSAGRSAGFIEELRRTVTIRPDADGYWYYDGWSKGLPTVASASEATKDRAASAANAAYTTQLAKTTSSNATSANAQHDENGMLLDGEVINNFAQLWNHAAKEAERAAETAAGTAAGLLFGKDDAFTLRWHVEELLEPGSGYESEQSSEDGIHFFLKNSYKPEIPNEPDKPNGGGGGGGNSGGGGGGGNSGGGGGGGHSSNELDPQPTSPVQAMPAGLPKTGEEQNPVADGIATAMVAGFMIVLWSALFAELRRRRFRRSVGN